MSLINNVKAEFQPAGELTELAHIYYSGLQDSTKALIKIRATIEKRT